MVVQEYARTRMNMLAQIVHFTINRDNKVEGNRKTQGVYYLFHLI